MKEILIMVVFPRYRIKGLFLKWKEKLQLKIVVLL